MLYLQKLRRDRGLCDKLFLLDVEKEDDDNIKLKICGTTKNVYCIEIRTENDNSSTITCDCYDMKTNCVEKNLICKHICFVYCKIIKNLDIGSDFFVSHVLTHGEKRRLLFNLECLTKTDSIFDEDLAEKFKMLTTKEEKEKDIEKKDKLVRNIDDDCPICFTELKNDEIVECFICKNGVHNYCMKIWLKNKKTCVFCRCEWKTKKEKEKNYLNLV